MIRILQVVTDMNRGGLETMLMNYYRNIDRSQVQFDFLTHREYDGHYGDEIKALGGNIYHLPRLNPFSSSYKKALKEFFYSHPEYKVIHVHQDCLSSVILKEAKKCGVPVRIAHSHNANQDKNIKLLIKLYFKQFIAKYSTHLFACSQEAGQWMFGGADFTILNNAINAKDYSFNQGKREKVRKNLSIADNQLIIGHVGRFCYPKNHDFLIEIFNELQKKVDAKLLLVGDDHRELGEEIHNKVVQLGLQDKVIFTGVRSDVADLLQAMDVFVFPSHYEGLPVTLVEAQAAGLPCLISDKVPIECKKTDLVEQVSLQESAETWANKAIEASHIERRNTLEEIKNAGYDIQENAKKLQEFYKKVYQGEKDVCL